MPGGSYRSLLLQKCFWVLCFVSIAFVGALLLAIYTAGVKRHPVVLGFLVASWLTSWSALLPLFGSVWDYSLPKPILYPNVSPGPPRVICNINAVLLAYMWTVIPGFCLAFVAELVRIFWESIRLLGHIKRPTSSESVSDEEKKHGQTQGTPTYESKLGLSEPSKKSTRIISSILEKYSFKTGSSDIERGSLHSNNSESHRFKSLWNQIWTRRQRKLVFVIFPMITALPSLFIVIHGQARFGWRYIHADPFFCYPPDPDIRRMRALIVLGHLAPASALGVLALLLYFIIRLKTRSGVRRPIHYPLVVRLSSMSAMTGLGAALEWYIEYEQSSRGLLGFLSPMYLITFPIVSAALFVDKEIIKEWCSWLKWNRRKQSQQTSSNLSGSQKNNERKWQFPEQLNFIFGKKKNRSQVAQNEG